MTENSKMYTTVLDRSEPTGISVLISGAGVGGLMAALEFWRRGCDVRIFERSKGIVTTGDSFNIGPTAINAFRKWPEMQQRDDEIAYYPLVAFCNQKGERIAGPMEFKELMSKDLQDESVTERIKRHSRPKFHRMLHEQLGKIGIEAEYDKEVVDYFEDEQGGSAGVVLKDGSRHEADLVVAADGVRGASWTLVAGRPVPARSSGDAIFRVAYPVELAVADPMVAERFQLVDGRSVTELWPGTGWQALFWRNEDEMSWAVQHPDQGTAEESWGHKVDPEEVLKFTASIADWPEVADRVIKTTPADLLVDWKLMWRDPQPKWTSLSGRVVQLGDAAHTFLPSSGNGGTQAIEDAVSLAACISKAGSKEAVPDATRVHNLLRFERVSCLQAFGVENREKATTGGAKGDDGKKNRVHVGKWILEHDPEKYALENYEQALASIHSGMPFMNTNTPPGLLYKPWTIDGLLEAQRRGEPTIFDADWS